MNNPVPMVTATEPLVPDNEFRSLVNQREMARYRHPAAVRLVFDLCMIWAQFGIALAVYLLHPTWYTFAPAFVLIAGAQHGLILATHEFSHYTIIPRSRSANDLVGTWLFGAPVGIPLDLFRHRHFRHHRTYSSAEDPKTLYRRSIAGGRIVLEAMKSLCGFDFIAHKLEARQQEASRPADERRPSMLRGVLTLIIGQFVMLLFFLFIKQPWLYLWLWLLPLLTLTELFQKIRAYMEHHPLKGTYTITPGSGFFGDTPGPFVRSVRASRVERLFISKLNFGYHAEHHLWPSINYQHLPEVRKLLEQKAAFDTPQLSAESSYCSAVWRIWRGETLLVSQPEATQSVS